MAIQGRVATFVTESINSDEPLDSLVIRLALTMTTEQQESPTLFLSLMVAISSNDFIRTRMAEGLGRGRETLVKFIEKRQQTGEIRSDLAAKEIAHSLQRMIVGTMLIWSLAPDRTLQEHTRDMVKVFVKGIQAG